MKRIIVTPTFRPHFPFNREFLQSYRDNVEDARAHAVHFVSTRDEIDDLRSLLAEFPELDLHAHAFEDFLERSGHGDAPLALLREVGKFAYQALKKLYALRWLEYDQALVLDSEALVIKPVRIGEVFARYYADPYILYSDLSTRGEFWFEGLSNAAVRNAAKMLGVPYPKMYFLEYYGWFYEKRLIADLFAAFGDDVLAAIRSRLGADTNVFECQLIYHFVFENQKRFPYRFVSVNDMLREYLGDEGYAEYLTNFSGNAEQMGIFEMVSRTVNARTLPGLTALFNARGLEFYRFDLFSENRDAQERLLGATPVAILTSSETYRRTRERIAVCLSGVPRNVRQNIRFLELFLQGSNVDVFFHFWDDPDREHIVRALQPKAHAFERREAAPEPPRFKRMEKAVEERRARDSTSMFYSIMRANELKRAYEDEHGFRYDVVVRLRLDVFTTRSLFDVLEQIRAEQKGWHRLVYVPDMAQSVGLNDQIAISSSDTMDTYAAAYTTLAHVAEHDYFNPEYVLLRHVQRSGLRIRTFPLEYVLLRDEPAATFDLEDHVRRTRETWWSAQLPPIAPGSLDAYFAAKVDSVALVDEFNLETPKVFRIRAGSRGYMRFETGTRRLGWTPDAAAATAFYVIIPANGDRTAVNIRPRELVLAAGDRSDAGALAYNLAPNQSGAVRADGPSAEDSAFFVGRDDAGLVFEWRPGFWTSVDGPRAAEPRPKGGRTPLYTEEMQSGARRVLQPSDEGLIVAPLAAARERFDLEYMPDPEAEAVKMGLDLTPTPRGSASVDPLAVRLLYVGYLAARVVSRRGVGAVTIAATDYLRRQAHIAERTKAPGLVNVIKRQIGKRL